MPRPMPRPPPVTRAAFPSSLPTVRRRTWLGSWRGGVGEHRHDVVADLGEAGADAEPGDRAVVAVGQHTRLERGDQRGVVRKYPDLAEGARRRHLAHLTIDDLALGGVDPGWRR